MFCVPNSCSDEIPDALFSSKLNRLVSLQICFQQMVFADVSSQIDFCCLQMLVFLSFCILVGTQLVGFFGIFVKCWNVKVFNHIVCLTFFLLEKMPHFDVGWKAFYDGWIAFQCVVGWKAIDDGWKIFFLAGESLTLAGSTSVLGGGCLS